MSNEHEVANNIISPSHNEVFTKADGSFVHTVQAANGGSQVDSSAASFESLLREGIVAAKAGDLPVARQVLRRAIEINDKHETALMWLASVSDKPQDLLNYLQKVLVINPSNERAAQWAKATKSLLAKSFIQQGAASYKEGMPEVAGQYFLKATELEPANEIAWLWLVSVATEPEDKLSYLQKVLNLNPQHEKALALFHTVKNQMARLLLKKGNLAAVAGDRESAREILRDVMEYNPSLDEAWILKAHLSDSVNQKIYCLEKALEINSENEFAAIELAALRAADKAPLNSNITIEVVEDSALDAEFVHDTVGEEEFGEEEFVGQRYAEPEITPEAAVEELLTESEPSALNIEAAPPLALEELTEIEPSTQIIEEELTEEQHFAEQESETIEEELIEQQSIEEEHLIEGQVETVGSLDLARSEEFAEEQTVREQETFEEAVIEQRTEQSPIINQSLFAPPNVHETGAASTVKQTPEKFIDCQFCQSELPENTLRCRNCGAFIRLENFEHLLTNELNDEEAARDFIARLQTSGTTRDLTAEEYFNLGLAYLNLRNVKKGIANLEQTMRLNRGNEELNAKISALLAYVREKMPEAVGNTAVSVPSGKTIMVVDDSPTVRKLIVSKLEKYGHRVIAAVDGMDALSKISESVPDLILLDITMPRMDGYQLCKVVKGNVATKHVPVVMISGKDGFFDKVRGRMAGSTAYITKPFGPETLLQTVESHCK